MTTPDHQNLRGLIDAAALRVAAGKAATIWTNDLTHDYVHENSAYST